MTQIIQTPEQIAAKAKLNAERASGFTSPEGRRRLGQQAPGGGYTPEKTLWEQMTQQAPVAPSGGDLPGGGTRQSLPENMSAGIWGGGPNLQVHMQAPESPSIAAPNITKPQPRPKRHGLHSGGGDKLFKITPAESA